MNNPLLSVFKTLFKKTTPLFLVIFSIIGMSDIQACNDIYWTPAPEYVCEGAEYLETSNCGNTRMSMGSRKCENCCTDTEWIPYEDTVCAGSTIKQTSNCGNTREIAGTKDCENDPCQSWYWTPERESVCAGETFLQTSNCNKTRTSQGIKEPIDGGWTDWTWTCAETGTQSGNRRTAQVPTWNLKNLFETITANMFGSGNKGQAKRYGVRTCNNPAPECGGANCMGADTIVENCEAGEICERGQCVTNSFCIPNCSCASATCMGSTCNDRCDGVCEGTKPTINGGWTTWSEWTCAHHSGTPPAGDGQNLTANVLVAAGSGSNGGAQVANARKRTRSCTNPSPDCGGADCFGESEQIEPCAANQVCSNGSCVNQTTYYWGTALPWSSCTLPDPLDNTCNGIETRIVRCRNATTNQVVSDSWCTSSKPPEQRACIAEAGTICGYDNINIAKLCNLEGVCTEQWSGGECEESCRFVQTTFPYTCETQPDDYWNNSPIGTPCVTENNETGECDGDGICVPLPQCQSHHYKSCYMGDSWWYDSCDEREDKYQECVYSCENGECQPWSCGDEIEDAQGNEYDTVEIGTQCWMKEDMETEEDWNGNELVENTDFVDNEYGRSYIKFDALCPTGWRIPTDQHWNILEEYFGMSTNDQYEWRKYRSTPTGDVVNALAITDLTSWGQKSYWTSTGWNGSCVDPHNPRCYITRGFVSDEYKRVYRHGMDFNMNSALRCIKEDNSVCIGNTFTAKVDGCYLPDAESGENITGFCYQENLRYLLKGNDVNEAAGDALCKYECVNGTWNKVDNPNLYFCP